MSTTRLLDNWSPPDGAGPAIACLATSFTFDADFFAEDCLARFLVLTTTTGEGDPHASLAALLEQEEALDSVSVSVLIDRSTRAESRSLRWDLLPVQAPGGLLHAKVALLVWERTCRVLIGSANLTPAGYRRQIETVMALDLGERPAVPRALIEDLVSELELLVDLVPEEAAEAKARARETVRLFSERAAALEYPSPSGQAVRLALAAGRPGVSPLDRIAEVWIGARPLRATILSPFWDDLPEAPAVTAVRARLTGRPASERRVTLMVGKDPFTGTFQAAASVARQPGCSVEAFAPPDNEPRTLHAKVLLVETEAWVAAMVGSSNATRSGYGLHPSRGHHELNIWLGCPTDSKAADALRALITTDGGLNLLDAQWEQPPDEDEVVCDVLPSGFVACTALGAHPTSLRLSLDPARLPAEWEVTAAGSERVLDSSSWCELGAPASTTRTLLQSVVPTSLLVTWTADGETAEASWIVNAANPGQLPPPPDLSDIPVRVLIAILASSRPLPAALEEELIRLQEVAAASEARDLDPLLRFDDSGLLFRRSRQMSLALQRLGERLAQPVATVDALRGRLFGAVGPVTLARGLVRAADEAEALPGEAHFTLAELVLTVARVPWLPAPKGPSQAAVRQAVRECLKELVAQRSALPVLADVSLTQYLDAAMSEALR